MKRGKIEARSTASAARNPSAAGTITPAPPDGLRAIQAIDFLPRIARFTHPTKNERRKTNDERRTTNVGWVKRGKIDARNTASAARNPSAAGTITPAPPDGLRAIQAIDFLHRIARFTHPTKNERHKTNAEQRT
ncbi:hypothetical protein [Achromobacter spanius]|uniref:Uncharacterized protein n=1 Tax=Achromobacter spanius TaxID=217203 RepID=A0AA42LUY7_9BURK|nr:hypothetical protein [Achromobacter spanius]MDH0740054.1 hypothetical protein [Achromobacter spanius]